MDLPAGQYFFFFKFLCIVPSACYLPLPYLLSQSLEWLHIVALLHRRLHWSCILHGSQSRLSAGVPVIIWALNVFSARACEYTMRVRQEQRYGYHDSTLDPLCLGLEEIKKWILCEIYGPSDHRLLAKLVSTFADREVSRCERGGSPTAVISIYYY
jgi:hypothetical protein